MTTGKVSGANAVGILRPSHRHAVDLFTEAIATGQMFLAWVATQEVIRAQPPGADLRAFGPINTLIGEVRDEPSVTARKAKLARAFELLGLELEKSEPASASRLRFTVIQGGKA